MTSSRGRVTLSLAQRAVVVAAYGMALWVLWRWIEVEGWRQIGADDLTTNYGPSGVVLNGAIELRTNVGLRLVVQLLIILVWLIPSLWLLRPRAEKQRVEVDPPPVGNDGD